MQRNYDDDDDCQSVHIAWIKVYFLYNTITKIFSNVKYICIEKYNFNSTSGTIKNKKDVAYRNTVYRNNYRISIYLKSDLLLDDNDSKPTNFRTLTIWRLWNSWHMTYGEIITASIKWS